MIAGISMFSVSDGILQVMEQTGRQQVDCSRDAGQQQQISDRQSDKPRSADVKKTGGRRAQPASVSGRYYDDIMIMMMS